MNQRFRFVSGAATLVVAVSVSAVALASGGAEHAAPTEVPFWVPLHTINLAIMCGIIYYFGRKPLRDYLVQRQDDLRSALASAESARADAEARAEEYKTRLAELESSAAEQVKRMEAESREEAERMVEHAHRNAALFREQTERLLEEELRGVRESLRRETVAMALTMAREMVSADLTETDHQRLFLDYVNDVKSSEVN